MQPDRYTRAVLTVIAAALVWLCVRDLPFVRPAQAAAGQPVVLVGVEGVGIGRFDPLPVKAR
jgi:hypothetical protein